MALIQQPVQSTDGKMLETAQGLPLFLAGPSFIQYKPSADLTNTVTETPVFGAADTTQVNFGPEYPFAKSSLGFPANSLTLGSIWEVKLLATIAATGTPNLIFKAYMNDPATPLVLTGTSILNGSTGSNATNFTAITGPTNAEITMRFIVTAVGTSGTIASTCKVVYSTGVNATDVALNTLYSSTTLNTTNPYVLNVTAKWSAASASNIFSLKAATVTLLG